MLNKEYFIYYCRIIQIRKFAQFPFLLTKKLNSPLGLNTLDNGDRSSEAQKKQINPLHSHRDDPGYPGRILCQ